MSSFSFFVYYRLKIVENRESGVRAFFTTVVGYGRFLGRFVIDFWELFVEVHPDFADTG